MRRLLPIALVALAACLGPEPAGLRSTLSGSGPTVRWDPTAKPLPEIPLPNNAATRLDPSSPTGRRLNVSLETSTWLESKVRSRFNELDGFGTFAPITVSFDADLDLVDLKIRHTGNHALNDDAILLVNVDRASPGFGESIPLDVGQGNVPVALKWPWQYWDFDPHADSPNLVFETHDEDANANGLLDPYEDTDFDGVLDKPNTWDGKDPGPNNIDTLITFWEKQTKTLILWPVAPMRPATTYAVVLTSNLKGTDGQTVRSPFPYVNYLDQTRDLQPLGEVLARPEIGMSVSNVSFAWSFTTQTIADDLIAIRKGLYGNGTMAALATSFPPDLEPAPAQDPDTDGTLPDKPFMLPGETLAPLITILAPILTYPDAVVGALEEDTSYVHHWVLGSYTTPWFLADKDGIATANYPADDNESFDVDPVKGTATVGTNKATFICSVPRESEGHKQPFPVIIYGHGFSGAPFELFGFAGRLARYGWSLCCMDAPGHGLALPVDDTTDWNAIVPPLAEGLWLKTFYNSFAGGRIRDLDNDGVRSSFDNGGDFWSSDIAHTRDMVRQAVVDHMQMIRILRSLGGPNPALWKADGNSNGLADDLMGDWDGNGTPDLGTAANPDVPVWGQSMGAFIAQIAAAVDPAVTASTPVSGGGGLMAAGMRSINPGVPEGVWMPMMGPMVTFTPAGDGTMELAWLTNHLHREYQPPLAAGVDRPVNRPHYYPFARITDILPGDTVVVTNKMNGETVRAFRIPLTGDTDTNCKGDAACLSAKADCQVVAANRNTPACAKWRGFRVSVPADALGAVEKRALLGLKDDSTQPVPVTCATGWWKVPVDDAGKPTGPASCDLSSADAPAPDLARAKLFGDAFQIDVYQGWPTDLAAVKPKATIDTFRFPITFEGAIFPEGSPLVAIGPGLGRARNTPDFRRLLGMAAMLVERGDPIAYAGMYQDRKECGCGYDELSCPAGTCRNPQTNMVMYHTIGDPNVSVGATLALARGAGILKYDGAEVTPNDLLLKAYVPEAVEMYGRHHSATLTLTSWLEHSPFVFDVRWPDQFTVAQAANPTAPLPLHADPDNANKATNEFGEPSIDGYTPQTLVGPAGGHLALRFPYTYPMGAHGVEPSNPSRQFNSNNYFENQAFLFMTTGGKMLLDLPCLADSTCIELPADVKESR
jgi:hypothetical protein